MLVLLSRLWHTPTTFSRSGYRNIRIRDHEYA